MTDRTHTTAALLAAESAYVTVDDFRADTLAPYCRGLALSETEISDDDLTTTIAGMQEQFDSLTGDHFAPAVGVEAIVLDSWGGLLLELPRRIRSIDLVEIADYLGVWHAIPPTAYGFDAFTGEGRQIGTRPILEISTGRYLTAGVWSTVAWVYQGSYMWPDQMGAVRITGTFGWPATPYRVKRAVALLAYDAIKASSPMLQRADRFSSADITYETSTSGPTGIPEVDRTIADYRLVSLLVA